MTLGLGHFPPPGYELAVIIPALENAQWHQSQDAKCCNSP
jgi:hypothetical protein